MVTQPVEYIPSSFVVVGGQGPTLFGRDNLSLFNTLPFSLSSVIIISDNALTLGLVDKFLDLFSEGLGYYCDYEATLDINVEAIPKLCKARTVAMQ